MRRELFLNLCKHLGMVTPLPEGMLLLAAVISTCYQFKFCDGGGDGNTAILTTWYKPITTLGPARYRHVTMSLG